MSSTTLSQDLVSLIRSKAISDADRHRAAIFMLDAVANAMAGRNTEAGRKLLQWGRDQGGDVGRRAFVTGGLTHILETDDLHRESVTHPGCVVVPAVLAVAANGQIAGPDVLDAVLQGFEAMCRVGNAVGPTHYQIWHNTATCGPFGSAMSTAALTDLTDEQAVHALGNAGTQSSGFWEFLETGAMSKHLHAGRAAESGIIAAQLAKLDFTGPPAVLEGSKGFFAAACPDAKPEAVLSDPDRPWQLALTSIKPWPCCRHTHPAVDAALDLHERLQGDEIASVNVNTYQAALDVCDRPLPQSEYEAKFSLYHTVAAALASGRVVFESFDEQARTDLASLRTRITVNKTEPFASDYPGSWGAEVSVTTRQGQTLAARRDGARGDPELALDDDEMLAKANVLLEFAGCDRTEADQIVAGVLGLESSSDTTESIELINQRLR